MNADAAPVPDPLGHDRTDLWEEHADWWQAHFTEGADPEYVEQILPLAAVELAGASVVVDIGCGEGQVARLAAARGSSVVALDPTWNQTSEAHRRGGGPRYLQASAVALPVASGCADATVACLVFEHITDVDAAISEVARVLRPGGRFCFFLNHPLLQSPGSGWIDDTVFGEQYWRVGSYLQESHLVEEVEKNVFIPFIHRPLGRYLNTLAAHGLYVTSMQEPAPPPGFLARAPEYQLAAGIPRLLYLRAEKLDRPGR